MDHKPSVHEPPTRRDFVKYGGAVIGGGLLAGCTTGRGESSENDTTNGSSSTDTASETSATANAGDRAYSVSISPVGTVTFDEPPESVFTIFPHYADMATAAGHGDAVNSMLYQSEYNDRIWSPFLERIPNVAVNWADLPGTWDPSKEFLYELASDLHLADSAYMTTIQSWDTADVEEIRKNIAPWFGNHYSYLHGEPPAEWAEGYRYYTLWEIFEKVARVFKAEARYEALASIHTDMISHITTNLPPKDERPSAAMIILMDSKEAMYVYPVNSPGFMTAHIRPLDVTDVFAKVKPESTVGFEALIEADPDAILCVDGMSKFRDVTKVRERLESNPATQSLSAVENGRIYTQGSRYQGPLMNLFQTEMTAKELYPDSFGGWPTYTGGPYPKIPKNEQFFDRQRVADIINGRF